MPELPEVETIVRGIRPAIVGRRIDRVIYAAASMIRCDDANGSCEHDEAVGRITAVLAGRQVRQLDRVGKWMFFRLEGSLPSPDTLVIHLGMTGRLGVVPASRDLPPHCHLRLALDDGQEELRFADPRRFGELHFFDADRFRNAFESDRLGPDAIGLRRSRLAAALARTGRRLKVVLLDQRVIAGIGNIYADEILFAARLSPFRPADSLDAAELHRLHAAIGSVLRRAIRHQGTSIRDYVTSHGLPGEFQNQLSVYGRVNLPCRRCTQPIQLATTAVTGRSTYWCPTCQEGG